MQSDSGGDVNVSAIGKVLLTERQVDGQYIVSVPNAPVSLGPQDFQVDYLQQHYQARAANEGRGGTWFFRRAGADYVLRHYLRGGWLGRVNRQYYIWHGLARCRAFKELRLLQYLHSEGFPVPPPLAARVCQGGWFYTADLITYCLPACRPLSAVLREAALPDARWRQMGAVLKRFHRSGVYHADLNAHNILLTEEQIYLVDFDKAELRRPGSTWQSANLRRLNRSLRKLRSQSVNFAYRQQDWQHLLNGYHNGSI